MITRQRLERRNSRCDNVRGSKRIRAELEVPSLEPLILDLLEWLGAKGRPYAEVMDAWRTSCPRLPVWEEANERGFIDQRHDPGSEALIAVSPLGADYLRMHRPIHPLLDKAQR